MTARKTVRACLPALAAAACVLTNRPGSAQCPPSGGSPAECGQWSSVYFWNEQVIGGSTCDRRPEFSHAALLPLRYRGHVLLWKALDPNCTNEDVTEAYLFNPDDPTKLRRIVIELSTSIFCSGASWDKNGNLVVAGGAPLCPPQQQGCTSPSETYRFDPRKLQKPPVYPMLGDPPAQGLYPLVFGDPWTQIGSMSLGRYYPTLITLDKTTLQTSCDPQAIAASAQLVLGGPPSLVGFFADVGTLAWQLLEPGAAQWTRTLVPAGVTIASWHQPAGATEDYQLVPAAGDPNAPEHLLDSYPRAMQLGERSPTGTDILGQIFLANDVDTAGSPPNSPGAAWVIKPPQATQPPQGSGCFELHGAPQSGGDRFYGSAVLMHMLGTNKNRVLVFGGSDGAGWTVLDTVQEFDAGTNPTGGTWHPKANMAVPRLFLNAVALPTGQVLLMGGDGFDDLHNGNGSPLPRTRPELYDPGILPSSSGSTRLLAESTPAVTPNPPPSCTGTPTPVPTPRGYHALAVLLPDGRVFVGGGDGGQGSPYPLCTFPDPRYSGELFSPPYLFHENRPSINTAPGRVTLGTSFTINVSLVHECLERVVLLRPAALTHHFDNDQRYLELAFEQPVQNQDGLTWDVTVTAPDPSLLPQGYSMLFAVESTAQGCNGGTLDQRVPSEAHFLLLD